MLVRPNPKYLKGMLEILGMENANSAPTPEVQGKIDEPGHSWPLDEMKAWECRNCVGKALYLESSGPVASPARGAGADNRNEGANDNRAWKYQGWRAT